MTREERARWQIHENLAREEEASLKGMLHIALGNLRTGRLRLAEGNWAELKERVQSIASHRAYANGYRNALDEARSRGARRRKPHQVDLEEVIARKR